METSDREAVKDFLAGLLERVELTLDGRKCVIRYRIRTGDSLASPRRAERIPAICVAKLLILASGG